MINRDENRQKTSGQSSRRGATCWVLLHVFMQVKEVCDSDQVLAQKQSDDRVDGEDVVVLV